MADIALALDLPVLLVVGLRLGCLNHALLTAQSIEASGARLAAWIGNHVEFHFERAMENVATLKERLGLAPLDILRFNPASPEMIALSSRAQGQAVQLLAARTNESSRP
jgi:dethiobiotin synthetase